jgi:hypothetical protein
MTRIEFLHYLALPYRAYRYLVHIGILAAMLVAGLADAAGAWWNNVKLAEASWRTNGTP